MFAKQFSHIRLIGVIKEIAPIAGIHNDSMLGVEVFQSKFFHNNQIFLDQEKQFCQYFGNRNVMSQSLHSHNPCTLYHDYSVLMNRLKEQNIDEYNFNGESYLQGGFLIIDPKEGVVFRHEELTGWSMPIEDISQTVMNLAFKYNLV